MANTPDEKQLVDLIAAAFDRLPDPAPSRLKAVEDRLVSALPRRNAKRGTAARYWWLIGALAASGAAAWWTGEHFASKHRNDELSVPLNKPGDESRSNSQPEPKREVQEQQPNADTPARTNQPPEIYRRERY